VRLRRRHEPVDLRRTWDAHADEWARWARAPTHDSYWRFHRDRFFALLPDPGRLTVDIGCGEGRVGRDLMAQGHRVAGVDGSPTLAALAVTGDPPQPTAVGDAARLPIRDAAADLAVAFMSLQDFSDLDGAVTEAGRILEPSGRFCLAIVHPVNSAGEFTDQEPDSPFVMKEPYLRERPYTDVIERDGLGMTFASEHRTIETFSRALERARFVVEAVREVSPEETTDQWSRIPMFLHMRARLAS
jgi:SAM-dependent methyltransferase